MTSPVYVDSDCHYIQSSAAGKPGPDICRLAALDLIPQSARQSPHRRLSSRNHRLECVPSTSRSTDGGAVCTRSADELRRISRIDAFLDKAETPASASTFFHSSTQSKTGVSDKWLSEWKARCRALFALLIIQ
jgi:hypothetical protein